MNAQRFTATTLFASPVDRLWRFHLQPGALEALSPPFVPTTVVDPGDGVANGSEVVLEVGVWPVRSRWCALHSSVIEGEGFVDVALESPFPYWVHHHRFAAEGPHSSRLTDTVWYLPPTWMPARFARPAARLALRMLFWWRHRRTRKAIAPGTQGHPTSFQFSANAPTGG